MRFVIQRVKHASVEVDQKVISKIGPGLLTLIGFSPTDSPELVDKAIEKIVNLRIFEDSAKKMNLSLLQSGGEHLLVSQFTLLADCSKGNRPSFMQAAEPLLAKRLYEYAFEKSKALGVRTAVGQFGADMKVELSNDGPVTIVLDF